MSKKIPGTRIVCPVRFTVEPGRAIYADGTPFISVHRDGSTMPSDVDTITHKIAEMLNSKCRAKKRKIR